jgi:hypothetical protein
VRRRVPHSPRHKGAVEDSQNSEIPLGAPVNSAGELTDFVRRGQAAQRAVDELTGRDRNAVTPDTDTLSGHINNARQILELAQLQHGLGEYDDVAVLESIGDALARLRFAAQLLERGQ